MYSNRFGLESKVSTAANGQLCRTCLRFARASTRPFESSAEGSNSRMFKELVSNFRLWDIVEVGGETSMSSSSMGAAAFKTITRAVKGEKGVKKIFFLTAAG